MGRLFTLPDVQLRILMQAFKKWYQDNEKEREYAEDQKRITEEIRTTLLNNDYLSKSSDGQLVQRIFDYSRKLEGPAFIRLGMPRITEKLEDIKRNISNYEILGSYHKDTGYNVNPLIKVLENLNRQIDDRHYEVGITFFLRKDLAQQIEDIWRMEIEPYLEEYFFDQADKVAEFRWEKVGKEIVS